jgi:hypothetical protein
MTGSANPSRHIIRHRDGFRHASRLNLMGIASLHPSYELTNLRLLFALFFFTLAVHEADNVGRKAVIHRNDP